MRKPVLKIAVFRDGYVQWLEPKFTFETDKAVFQLGDRGMFMPVRFDL